MGIYDRDYMKAGWRGRQVVGWSWAKWVLVGLVVLVLAAFVMILNTPETPKRSHRKVVATTFPLDANSAPLEELVQIPFLHVDVAEALIAARPFSEYKDLDRVYGIGPKTFERLKL